jgi:hypothetical protein
VKTIKEVFDSNTLLRLNYNLRKPRENHPKCYGRGYVGTRDGEPILCQCVLKEASYEERAERIKVEVTKMKLEADTKKMEVK